MGEAKERRKERGRGVEGEVRKVEEGQEGRGGDKRGKGRGSRMRGKRKEG